MAWDAPNTRLIVADAFSSELSVIGEDNTTRGVLTSDLRNPLDVVLLGGSQLAVTTSSGEMPLFALATTAAPLAPPRDVVASDRPNDDGGAIVVTWTAGDARASGYRIERAAGTSEAFEVLDSVGGTSFTDTRALAAECYRYRVVATDGASDAASEPSLCVAARNDLAPAAPSFVTAAAESPFAASVEWEAVRASDLASYAVELTANGQTIARNVSATSVAFTGLAAETTYSVAVRAIDVAGNASQPALAQLTTYADIAPAAPMGVIASDEGTGGAIVVSFSAVDGAVAKYRIDATPRTPGWPAASIETTATTARLAGLVNRLAYDVTVTAITPWGHAGDPSPGVSVTPTVPPSALPIVAEVAEPAGVVARFSIEAEKRTLRFQYRAANATLQLFLDGSAIGAPLADTSGAWSDGSVEIEKRVLKATAEHELELRNLTFPDPRAEVAVRRVDFVPLAPKQLSLERFNSVVDVTWQWQEWRADLGVKLTRDGIEVPCATPALARCRDAFLINDAKHLWTLAAISPAGWSSDANETRGEAKWSDAPPPVTDVVVEGDTLRWTPISSSATKDSAPVPIAAYRIYANGALIAEVPAPPYTGASSGTIVVRAVDAQGRESQ